MPDRDFSGLDYAALCEHRRLLWDPYRQACIAYEHDKAADIHREMIAAETEMRRRPEYAGKPNGLEDLTMNELVQRFVDVAIERADCDDPEETDRLYWVLDEVEDELRRRPGDQRRALFTLYRHPHINVRTAAATATADLAPLLARHRQRNIDDEDWRPPSDGLDIVRAKLEAVFPERTDKPDRLKMLSAEALKKRFVDLTMEDDDAEISFDVIRRNQLFFLKEAVVEEFKQRPAPERKILLTLYRHRNPRVRREAAKASADLAPDDAKRVLERTDMNAENRKPARVARRVIGLMKRDLAKRRAAPDERT